MNIIERAKAFLGLAQKKATDSMSEARSIIEELKKAKRNTYSVRKPIAAELQQQELRQAITSAETSPYYYYYPLHEILRQVSRDGHLKAVINQRSNAVLAESYTITGDSDFFKGKWFRDFIRLSVESIFWGFSVVSLDFSETEKPKVKPIDRAYINPTNEQFIPVPFSMTYNGVPLDAFNDALFVKYDEEGLLSIAARYVIWKSFSLSDWARYSEKFGMPTVIVKTDSTSEDELNKLMQMIANMGSNGGAILDKRDEFMFAEASKTDAHQVFLELTKLMNEEISKIIVGQTMTTDNGSSQSQANVHERVLETFTMSDLTFVQFIVNDMLLPWLVKSGLISANTEFSYDVLTKEKTPMEKKPKAPSEKQKAIENFIKASPANAAQDLPKNSEKKFEKALKNAAKKIHDDGELNLSAELMSELTNLTYDILLSAFNEDKAKYYGSDTDFTQTVNDNLFIFSGYKTYAELRAIADLLLDADGEIVPYGEFLNSVLLLNPTYNSAYLYAEYNNAIATAQSITRWKRFESGKDEYDLVFDAVNDARTRPSHRALDGIVRSFDDSFWDTYNPPLDWGCRCLLRQVPKGTASAAEPAELPILKPVFATNPAKTGVVFPESHPYFDVSTSEKKEIDGAIKEMKK